MDVETLPRATQYRHWGFQWNAVLDAWRAFMAPLCQHSPVLNIKRCFHIPPCSGHSPHLISSRGAMVPDMESNQKDITLSFHIKEQARGPSAVHPRCCT